MASKNEIQAFASQYTRGFLDACPREGYHPKPGGSGTYVHAYHEGYSDGQTARHLLAAREGADTEFRHLVKGDGAPGSDADPDFGFALVRHLRKATSTVDVRVDDPARIYQLQNVEVDKFCEAEKSRELAESLSKTDGFREAVRAAVAAERAAEREHSGPGKVGADNA